MLNRKSMSNLDIFNTANALAEAFTGDANTNFPVKVNFFLQKNMKSLIEMAQDIEKSRMEIIQKYGNPSEEDPNQYTVPADKIDDATKELDDLFTLEQEVAYNELNLDWFDNINMNGDQVAAISYMIKEEE